MEQNSDDAGLQFVLDNRRLILWFALLIVLCGGFFVLGFVEGKRQTAQIPAAAAPPVGPMQGTASKPPAPEPGASKGAAGPDERAVRDRLDWYSQVGAASGGRDRNRETSPGSGSHAATTKSASEPSVRPAAPAASGPATYTVQVGAFRQRKEAESKAAMLQARGYDYKIEPPTGGDQLYLLKVGRFTSRADAVALQLKLRKDGFSTFIKTN